MQKSKVIKVIIGLFVVAVLAVFFLFFTNNTQLEKEEFFVEIPTGSTYDDAKKIISPYVKSMSSFEIMAKLRSYPDNVKPGRFLLKKGMNSFQLVGTMRRNVPVDLAFNNQERLENFAGRIGSQIEADSLSLLTAFKDKNGSTVSSLFNEFMVNRPIISNRLGAQNPNSSGNANGFADGYNKSAQDVIISSFLAAYTGKKASSSSLNSLPKIPLPNWRITYGGLSKIPFIADRLSELSLRHGYRSTYSVNGFNSLIKYQETNGFVSSRDVNQNFLPFYQFSQVNISEQFAPLIGVDARLKNNFTTNFEINKTRIMALSLANSQLAQLSENNLVFGLGYRTTKFRFPFGLFKQLKMDNNMDFKLDISVRDNKTVIYRADIVEAEVSSGAKNITLRPSVDYVLNQRFNVRLFYDSNITKPYTSQSFNTSFSNFGFSLRATLN